ncbi:Na+:H+ antiporter, NhaA family [Nitrosospira sp. Nsp14]|uniref:Na+/H+ antiporter NhaA n=1 Tax=Nitrosospira sp. Nsp14 TaxID=1855333 RepID=UPI0008E8D83D|nr:Na+/H+ antiporter NhaA [Nitrosospira sp. Nsp14]SFH59899.1 Na+:H+ antiporter, NhaA family [Nitrosospira sp. Nsp14]
MSQVKLSSKLDRPVDNDYDHTLGPAIAEITLVEYGSYACPHCRAANERIAQVRDQLGDRLRYVFRHYPLTGSDIALRAAELVEHAKDAKSFWDAHIALMTRSEALTEEDLIAVARDLGMPLPDPGKARDADERAKARVQADVKSAQVSHALVTPTFFINGRRYDDPWDESSFADAMLGAPGHRLRGVALDFADWAPSAGVLLLLATILAVALTNSSLGTSFVALWEQYLSISLGGAEFGMSLLHWINDGLLAIFFLVVGLEIKREFTVGRLASARSAALPVAAAVGGMAVPAILYLLLTPAGAWSRGWGVPMATDTAFAVALIVMMGNRVPAELRVFLTAAAIVDDIGAITVVAIFYSGTINYGYLAGTAAIVAALALLNRSHIYSVTPYILLGIVLWACVLASGLHATMAGVILALFVPTRQPPNLTALMVHADAILTTEARRSGEILRHGPSLPAMRALDAIHDRLESPADRLLRNAGGPSSYVVLPLFALANAGVAVTADALTGHEPLMLAIIAGLVIGKPLGLVLASAIAVWLGIATKPDEYSWRQLIGAGALAGIGFTMSLFIASQAFPTETDFAAAKIAVFAASIASAILGVAILWNAGGQRVGNRGQ